MLLCQRKDCACYHHRLIDSIQSKVNDEAKSLLQTLGFFNIPCDLVDDSGLTLLHYSIQCGNVEMAKHLLEVGCNVNAQDRNGFSPLTMAVLNVDSASVEILLKNRADIYLANRDGVSNLVVACHKCINLPVASGKYHQQRILEAFFEKLNDDFSTDRLVVEQLLLNASHNVKLAMVVFGGTELVRFVLDNGYAVNCSVSTSGHTALHCAIIAAKFDSAKLLIEHGANVNAQDNTKCAPMYYYMYNSEKADEESRALKMLLRHSKNLTGPNIYGMSELDHLLHFGNKKTVKTVLQNVVGVAQMKFNGGKSLLHLLIENINHDVLDLLDELDIDVDVNSCDSYGHTALVTATRSTCLRKVEFLLKLGADVNLTINTGRSALYYAPQNTDPKHEKDVAKIIELLLQHGANARIVINDVTPILSDLFIIFRPELSAKVIVAHLALIGVLDEACLTDTIREEIGNCYELKVHFDVCTKQLEEMKNVQVYQTLSLLDLLNKTEEKVQVLARNQDFVLAFNTTMEKMSHMESYYLNTLNRKMLMAIGKIEFVEKIAAVIEVLTGISSDVYRVIVYKIISYLGLKELNILSKV